MTKDKKTKRGKKRSDRDKIQRLEAKIKAIKRKAILKHKDTVVDIISFLVCDDMDKLDFLLTNFESFDDDREKINLLQDLILNWGMSESAVAENFSLELPEINLSEDRRR